MEFLLGAISGSLAVCVTNPLEVVKCRYQLQGELKAKGSYAVHYRNIFHATYTIAKTDGILALQKGLAPSIFYQVILQGCRLGFVQVAQERQWINKEGGGTSILRSMAVSIAGGCVGGFLSTPFYLVKIHLMSKANESIAVGYQHKHTGVISAFRDIHSKHGIKGLYRGAFSIVTRITIASGTQIPMFIICKEYLKNNEVFAEPGGTLDAVVAAFIAGAVQVVCMTPFDVVSTRFCNQGVDARGKGLLYRNTLDCFLKTLKAEGIGGLYKGILPCYFRVGPYSLLSLTIWDSLKSLQKTYNVSR